MKFNNTAYFVPNKTKNNTNLKTYSDLKNEFSFYSEFQLTEFGEDNECTVICRQGFSMGIFLQKPNILKFVWYTKDMVYNDIYIEVPNIYAPMKILVSVSDKVKIYDDGTLLGEKPTGELENYENSLIYIGATYPYTSNNEQWFNGEINRVCVFNKSIDTIDFNSYDVYFNVDFNYTSKFKAFDLSGNGNHPIYHENPIYSSQSINEFNKVAPAAKII
jgi:hypothetical protein